MDQKKYYVAMDGGGTKLQGILFDEDYRIVSAARTEGTHLSVYSEEAVRGHVKACYEELFKELWQFEKGPIRVERLYTICGNNELFASLLPEGINLGSSRDVCEAVSALYAGAGKRSGFVAIAGTGSDVFAVCNDKVTDMVGGFGAVLGDEGSGVWISRLAMQAAIRAEEGWGEPTSFGQILKGHYGFSSLWDYADYLYKSPAPFRRLGELLPLVAKTAAEGDTVMREIFEKSGVFLARQMTALLRRNRDMELCIIACGGAWKANIAAGNIMAESFEREVKKEFPEARLCFPRFEHIMAGPICLAMEQNRDIETIMNLLAENFPQFVWNNDTKTRSQEEL